MRAAAKAALLLLGLLIPQAQVFSQTPSVYNWLDDLTRDVRQARAYAIQGRITEAQSLVLRAYLDRFETLEAYYGPAAKYTAAGLAEEVQRGEVAFHLLLRSADARAVEANAAAVERQLASIRTAIRSSGVQTTPEVEVAQVSAAHAVVQPDAARSAAIRAPLEELSAAAAAYRAGDAARALALVEHAYLEGIEPLESRLPSRIVDRIEKSIHLGLRPAIRRNADAAAVSAMIGSIGADLLAGDRFLAEGHSASFAAVNSFVIILREGLEAVLLIAALIAYLGAVGAAARYRRQIYLGVAGGIAASVGTWFLAATLLPISGANRELLEGVTALVAVVVLLYVANWLFQKTYIHDWKDYLRARVGGAMTRGSAFAMASLAFAAVYREGFETVLFYQALAFDSGIAPILAGFVPGIVLIAAIGFAIIRAGLKLPLKKVFAWTNAILMYLAFVFIGKGLYNLQEAGIFAPHPLPLPDHPALRQLLGFYPVIETIAAQLAFLLLIAATYAWYRRKKKPALSAPVQQTSRLPEPRVEARRA